MAWRIKGDLVEACSCAAVCPCLLGPAKPDQGWCSGILALNVSEGESEGVDLSGTKVVIHVELLGDFLGGIEKAKLYVDPAASDEQRREIDAIFHGEKGGVWGGMKEAIGAWLPTTFTKVEFTNGSSPGVTVESAGEVHVQPITTEDGAGVTITNAPILGALGIGSANLGFGTGTKFSDPDMRSWESLGHGTTIAVEWSG